MSQAGVFSDLPAIFARNVAQEGLQVQQGMLARFGTREARRETLVQGTSCERPAADLLQEGREWRIGSRLRASHAFLLADGTNSREFFLALECHIQVRKARNLGRSREKPRESGLLSKCHCSETHYSGTS